jgi:hypothetical protein
VASVRAVGSRVGLGRLRAWPRALSTIAAIVSCSTAGSCGSPTPPKPVSVRGVRQRRSGGGLQRHDGDSWWSGDFPGFQVGKKEDKLGLRASSTCELLLDNCRVPRENVMGEVGKGYKIAIETLNEGRIAIGAQMIGLGPRRARSRPSSLCANERKQFGKPIAEFQGVQFQTLAKMATSSVEAARLLVYNAARLRDAGRAVVHGSGHGEVLFFGEWPKMTASKADRGARRRGRSPGIARWRSCTGTPKSGGFTKAPAICSC